MLKVAEKYQVDTVKRFVTAQMERDWPTSIFEWATQRAELSHVEMLDSLGMTSVDGPYPDDVFPEPAAAIRLAVDYGIPSILPAAFYCLSTIGIEDDWDRYRGGPWLFGEQKNQSTSPICTLRRTARWSLLDKDILQRLFIGRTELDRRMQRFGPHSIEHPCNTSGKCSVSLVELWNVWMARVEGRRRAYPVLEAFFEFVRETRGSSLCWLCQKMFAKEIDDEMCKVWNDLPRIFSIDTLGLGEVTPALMNMIHY